MEERSMRKKPVVLMILDGYGLNDKVEGNAVAQANTPVMDSLMKEYPFVHGNASGMAVGLPEGQMGNSEVGHMNMGAGRIVYQELTRITKEIQDGDFFKNEALLKAIDNCKKNNSALHLMGLLSDGGVHSHITHLYGLLELAKQQGLEKVYVHCFLDGRDTPPASGKSYAEQLNEEMKKIGVGRIASVMGRYYAMDRDNNYDRVQLAYDAMTEGKGLTAACGICGIQESYDREETDEFVKPTVVVEDGKAVGLVQDKDSVIFFNFRPDRAREITRAFCDDDFKGFDRVRKDITFVCFSDYDPTIPNKEVAFHKIAITNTFGEWLAAHDMKQARIAETEKYAHVTFFFNGGVEQPNEGEDRILVNSPKDVATYDLKPQMSVLEVTDRFLEAWAAGPEKDGVPYTLAVCNLANPDMVGHTGVIEAAVKALEYVDGCVARLVEVVLSSGGRVLMTADHGNVEVMLDETGHPQTAHTCNQVPLVVVERGADGERAVPLRSGGKLGDIAPTLLDLWGLAKPGVMSGESLVEGVRG